MEEVVTDDVQCLQEHRLLSLSQSHGGGLFLIL